jgi:hypothetical protein
LSIALNALSEHDRQRSAATTTALVVRLFRVIFSFQLHSIECSTTFSIIHLSPTKPELLFSSSTLLALASRN